jgi:hypothetical protein
MIRVLAGALRNKLPDWALEEEGASELTYTRE